MFLSRWVWQGGVRKAGTVVRFPSFFSLASCNQALPFFPFLPQLASDPLQEFFPAICPTAILKDAEAMTREMWNLGK